MITIPIFQGLSPKIPFFTLEENLPLQLSKGGEQLNNHD